ncbi:hypothetical protein DICVIV_06132 [Dictyocaulus viviparus]|uniref:Uncharacterized protein n=1 Tax=Dictyocaulus viviparus TaxID=29172 RepID=A0A0D8XVI6_DICVI|nr:hypothetical protein DICVIV_06132 [Dictyocaulus viviparus]
MSTLKQLLLPQPNLQRVQRILEGRHFRSFLKAFIFIEIVTVCGLISSVYVVVMKAIMRLKILWEVETLPKVGYFEEFAVSSSSELCTELARTMYVEGFAMNLIALAMQYCLHLQNPDRSGELGSSVAVHYSPNGCRYTRGESRAPENKTLTDEFVSSFTSYRVDSLFRGPYSELVPLDLVTTLGFLENATESEIEEVALMIKSEHGDKCIALTINEVDPLELGLLITK